MQWTNCKKICVEEGSVKIIHYMKMHPPPPKKKQFHIFFSLQKQFHLRALRNTIYFLKKNLIFTYIFRIPLGDLR